jgi:peptidoglycan/xylan/chitin deacetylase (PgdA/CDA1 family)
MADFIINLHGVGSALRAFEPGEEPYWITDDDLERTLAFVERHPRRESIRFTVDDGNRSDHTITAPALRRHGMKAIFFVLAGRIESKGYLSKHQVRELCDQGFDIGSHGINHIDWTKVSDEVLERELKDSKSILEDITGRTIHDAAIPFGRYDGRVLRMLRRCGYCDVFSSDGGPRLTVAWPIPRYSLRRDFDLAALSHRIETSGVFWRRALTEARIRIKASLRKG